MPYIIRTIGKKFYQQLEQFNLETGMSTGFTKPNLPTDPDYIPPFDSPSCPTTEIRVDETTTTTSPPLKQLSTYSSLINIATTPFITQQITISASNLEFGGEITDVVTYNWNYEKISSTGIRTAFYSVSQSNSLVLNLDVSTEYFINCEIVVNNATGFYGTKYFLFKTDNSYSLNSLLSINSTVNLGLQQPVPPQTNSCIVSENSRETFLLPPQDPSTLYLGAFRRTIYKGFIEDSVEFPSSLNNLVVGNIPVASTDSVIVVEVSVDITHTDFQYSFPQLYTYYLSQSASFLPLSRSYFKFL